MDDDSWYQCKLCQERFRTTAELQKHKRVNHRPTAVVAKKSAPPPIPSPEEQSDSELIDEGSEQLACGSCRHQFDTRDPVVLHLLRQNRNENGALKCPYCVKVQLKKSDFLASKMELRTSPVRNLSMRRRSRSTGSNERPKRILDRQLLNKGKRRKPLVESTVSASPLALLDSLSSPAVPASPVSAQAIFKTTSSSSSSLRKRNFNRSFGVAYKQSDGTNGDRSTIDGEQRRSSEVLRSKKYSDAETPLKLPVLINDKPLTNDRLAVPRAREYDKSNITCQYCGFVANSFREVQFHINTHMAKSYPCEFCAAIYRSKQAVLKHTANHHAEEAKAKQLLSGTEPADYGDSSMGAGKVYLNGNSSSMTSELSGEEYDQLTNSNLDSSVMIHDETSASSHFHPQEEENAGTGYGFQEKYFSTDTDNALYENSQPHEFVMVDTSLEKVVDLANF
ncbi:unnamed protein product [Orchesella dallaii]